MGLAPLPQGLGPTKTGFDRSPDAAITQQALRLTATGHRIEGIQKDGFTGTGFTREHRETRTEHQLLAVDQGDIADVKPGEHGVPKPAGAA